MIILAAWDEFVSAKLDYTGEISIRLRLLVADERQLALAGGLLGTD
jgi:hypothetical protein